MKKTGNLDTPLLFYHLAKDESNIKYSVREHTNKSDFQFDMHYELEIGIVYSGKIERIYNDYKTVLTPGMVWLNSMWEPHGYSLLETPCKLVMFFFKPELLFNIDLGFKQRSFLFGPFTKSPNIRPHIPEHYMQDIISGADKIERLKNINSPTLEVNIRLLLIEILTILTTRIPEASKLKSNSTGYFEIQPAIELLFSKKSSVTDTIAADSCGMSRRTFTNKFKKIMHISYAKFCLQYRLRQASIQLKNTNDKMNKVAYDNGFSDVSHFYRCFNRYYGCSPVKYRQGIEE